jgi:hypothetical protein
MRGSEKYVEYYYCERLENVREEDAEENVWTLKGGSGGKLKNTA